MNKRKSCLLLGYLNLNFGDDLFFKIIARRYPNIDFYIYPPSSLLDNYLELFKKNKNIKLYENNLVYKKIRTDIPDKSIPINMFPEILKKAKEVDAIVYIGGSLFIQSENYKNSDFFKINNEVQNKNIFILGCNFGPGDKEFHDYYLNYFKNINHISFRDNFSYIKFNNLKNVSFHPDIAFSLKKPFFIRNKKIIGISVIDLNTRTNLNQFKEDYHNKIIEIIRYYIKLNYIINLISFCENEKDEKAIWNIISKLDSDEQNKIELLYYTGDMEDFLLKFKKMEKIISTRLHGTITGLIYNKKVFSIAYSKKITNILDDLNNKNYVLIEDINKLDINKLDDKLNNSFILPKNIKNEAIKHFSKLDEFFKKVIFEILF